MAPLLFHLRIHIRKQGSRKGLGFGAWVTANLSITRRTADTWANDYGVKNGLMKPRSATSRNISKSPADKKRADVFRFTSARPSWFTVEIEKEFHEALVKVGDQRAIRLMVEAVLEAAKPKTMAAGA